VIGDAAAAAAAAVRGSDFLRKSYGKIKSYVCDNRKKALSAQKRGAARRSAAQRGGALVEQIRRLFDIFSEDNWSAKAGDRGGTRRAVETAERDVAGLPCGVRARDIARSSTQRWEIGAADEDATYIKSNP